MTFAISYEICRHVDKTLPLKQLIQANWNGDLSKMSNCTQNFRFSLAFCFFLAYDTRLHFQKRWSNPMLIIISCDNLSKWMKHSKGDDMVSDVCYVADNWNVRWVIKLNWKLSNKTFKMILVRIDDACHCHF